MDPYGLPVGLLAEACGVSFDTARRWKRQGRIAPPADRLAALVIGGELGTLSAPWTGFILRQKIIWTPEGFSVTPGQICAIPYRLAQIAVSLIAVRTTATREDGRRLRGDAAVECEG